MQMKRSYSEVPEIMEWMQIVETGKPYKTCEEQRLLVKHVKNCFETEKIYVEDELLSNYMHLLDAYFPFKIFPWQKFVITLHDCTFRVSDNRPRWKDLFCMLGRGAGKDGMIAMESFCLSSPYSGIDNYDVDICANNEEQGTRPVRDLVGFFENPKITAKIKRFYYWTKEQVVSKKTGAVIKGRTNNPKGKDGLRSGIVILNEIHQYQSYDNINVFTTGLGKKPHPRRSYYTTNGEVREGPLDDLIEKSVEILKNGETDRGMLPFICRLESKEEVYDESNWTKANPSLYYLPDLYDETREEYEEWKEHPERLPAFLQKRMNLTETTKESAAAKPELIKATNKEIPDVEGWSCTVGIDYAMLSDWAAVNFHFKNGNERYDINKAWICRDSKDITRIKAPWQEWCKTEYMEYVDDIEIHPSVLTSYIAEMGSRYNIEAVAIDNFRYALMSDALSKIGVSKENGNLILVYQRDIVKLVPVIDHCFIHKYFHWGNNMVLRWATNNTKVIPYGKECGSDKGSFVYAKIEAKSRKTDPFMALVASMVAEGNIKERPITTRISVMTF